MKKGKKDNELDYIISLISKGFTKQQIRKKLNLSKTSLSNRLRELENLGTIIRKGKYEIEVLRSSSIHPKVTNSTLNMNLNKRGHAFNFKVIFPMESDLRLKPEVKKFTLDSNRVRKLSFGSFRYKHKKNTIWINKESLTIYTNKSYYSSDALHSKFNAMKDISILCDYLKQKFGFTGKYGIEIFREHYGLIFNDFAVWLLERGSKLKIENNLNKSILWVDDSLKDDINLKELESNNPLTINKADKFFNSQLKTNWEVTPEFTLDGFNKLTDSIQKLVQNQSMIQSDLTSLKFPNQLNIYNPLPEYIR